MDHRIPHYFTSVPTDNTPRQSIAPYTSKANRPAMDQHSRMPVLEPPCKWSRAATASPSAAAIQLSRRRIRTPPADVVGSAAEEGVISNYGYPTALTASADWLNHPSSSHYPNESLHLANRRSSTASDSQKRWSAHTPPRHVKMRRIHREDLGMNDGLTRRIAPHGEEFRSPGNGTPRLLSPASINSAAISHPGVGTHTVEAWRLTTTANPTVGYSHGGLSYAVAVEGAVRGDGSTLHAGTAPTTTEFGARSAELNATGLSDPSAHSYRRRKGPHPVATYSQALFSDNNVMLDPPKHAMKFPEIDPRDVITNSKDKHIQNHRYDPLNKEVQIMPQKQLVVDYVDSTQPCLRNMPRSSQEDRQKEFAKGFIIDTAKDSVNFPCDLKPKIPPQIEKLPQDTDSSFPDYHKVDNFCPSISSNSSTSLKPLTSFQKFPSHFPYSTPLNEPHRNSFTGGSLRESYEFNKRVVAAFDLTSSRRASSRDVDCSKKYPAIQTQNDLTNNLYLFPKKSLHESADAEAFNDAWQNEKMNQPSTHTIPAHTSESYYPMNFEIHAPPSRNSCYSSSGVVQSDITNNKGSVAELRTSGMKFTTPQMNQPDSGLPLHNLEEQNFGASYNSTLGTTDKKRSRNPNMGFSTCSRVSTAILLANTETSSVIEINGGSGDNICKEDETHAEKNYSVVLTSSQKKYNGTCHSLQFPSADDHSETIIQGIASNSQRGNSKLSHSISGREPQPNISPYQSHDHSSKSKLSAGGTRRKRRHAVGLICGVCGDSARSLHFGGVSCDSCKAFFRRAVIARAYPSFLCVTTSLPPKIKCQKGEKSSIKNSKALDNPEMRLPSSFQASSQPYFSPINPHQKVQSASNSGNAQTPSSSASNSVIEDDKLSPNNKSLCPIPEGTTPNPDFFPDGNCRSSFSISNNIVPTCHSDTSHLTPMHKITLSEKCSDMNISGSKQGQHGTNTKDAQHSIGSKKFVKCPPITIATRKYCQACRFQRCIDIGMEVSWVTLENDAQKNVSNQHLKNYLNSNESNECRFPTEDSGTLKKDVIGRVDNKDNIKKDNSKTYNLNEYLTFDEKKQIEDLVDIYRSVFWGVPEPSYYRPALIDFPPPFASSEIFVNTNELKDEIKQQISYDSKTTISNSSATHSDNGNNGSKSNASPASSVNSYKSVMQSQQERVYSSDDVTVTSDSNMFQEVENNDGLVGDNGQEYPQSISEHYYGGSENPSLKSSQPAGPNFSMPFGPDKEEENPVLGMSVDEIIKLPKDPRGVNMFRKPLIRRPRPWLIRQLMGYTLRFLNVVLKLLKSVGRSLSAMDRTILLRQGMTGLTFMNSVFTYDTEAEGWPERVFPPLPLVLQDDDSGCASDQPDYLQGVPMHSDEVASVVAADVLEHQLTFIRGMKALVGDDYTCMFLLMAIMLFDSTQEGLEQPQAVEKIQGNYCHLLKQYVGWKFRDGSPKNPGIGRPFNFTPLSHVSWNVSHLRNPAQNEENASSMEAGNTTISEKLCSKDLSGTSEVGEKRKCHSQRNIFKFVRPEGMYYSPPYPPSPINPSSIFPFLMTRLADLKQIAHGYSSTPFLLQGSEVDEIANLVARIEVFMSDIIATEPERDFQDKGGSGGGVGGSGGNQNPECDDMDTSASKPGKKTCSRECKESSKQISDSNTQQQDEIPDNYDTNWGCIPEQDFEWDSYSSGGDSNSISSQSAVSIGSTFDDIVGVLEAGEGEKLGNVMECGPEEVFESLEIWEKDHSIPNLNETEEYLVHTCRDNTFTYGKEYTNALDFNKSMNSTVHNLTNHKCEEQPIKMLQNRFHLGESIINDMHNMKATPHGEDNPGSLSSFIVNQSFQEESNTWDKAIHCTKANLEEHAEVNQNKVMDRDGNLDQYERGVGREQSTFISGKDKPSEQFDNENVQRKFTFKGQIAQEKTFQITPLSDELLGSYHSVDTRSEVQNSSLWDRIKATGKALLGLNSSGPHFHQASFWKGGINVDEHTILQEVDGDLENWLNPLERPDSNSSGYVSTISSPPPLLNVQREFDAYDSGGDWEDLFQKL